MKAGPSASRPSWSRRIAWLVGIWAAGVAVLAVAAYALRLIMNAAGMSA
ncbi:MAG: DUF2474 family protein [Burkholderiaceae bacterium]